MLDFAIVISVFNEEDMLPDCLASIAGTGIAPDRVVVVDGAWQGGRDGAHTFAGSAGPSTDATEEIVRTAGANWLPVEKPWPSQEAKRSAMFKVAGAERVLVMDADERLVGSPPSEWPDWHSNVMIKDVGENDMPGVRGEWPLGDYCADFKPELRFFRVTADLECAYPGGYISGGRIIKAYADAAGTSALEILEGLKIEHHANERSEQRKQDKRAYYKVEHPERVRWQNAIHKAFAE